MPSWGAVLCLVAALAYAGGVIAQKPLLARVSPLQVTWLACTAGAVACLPFAGSLWRDASAAPASALAWVVYLGIVPTAIGFIAWALCAVAHDRRADGLDDVPRDADRDPAGLAAARRDAAGARARRRRAVPRRCRDRAATLT